ncbi:SWIM zinc finger family protein [Methanocalculus chunghsingensis]|uniref:SWIM zinc finger family protein n=1 Tax=Methanocalculus chunghsingensis TaxID=156457 RepID=UPI001B8AF15C|nr:SWIM zinc finger family protein [Methanocalculus chunghsingensis]
MSPWYPSYEKTSPIAVKNGIKAKSKRGAIGDKWWSKRFISALERMGNAARLQRGRSYARKGQVISLLIQDGCVESKVQGSRRSPYSVSIRLRSFTEGEWTRILDAMAAEALYSAQLLAGEVPAEIEKIVGKTGLPLFPDTVKDIRTDCSCPDWENPCKHIAAAYYLLAERFDDDPFLIFSLRGKTKEEVLAGLKARRRQVSDAIPGEPPVSGDVSLSSSQGDGVVATGTPIDPDRFWKNEGEPAEIAFSITGGSEAEFAALRLCGEAPFTIRGIDPAAILLPVYPVVRKRAYEMAVGSRLDDDESDEGRPE